jgi:hypothetical protein
MFDHSAHGPFWDEPERFNAEVSGFIAALGTSQISEGQSPSSI